MVSKFDRRFISMPWRKQTPIGLASARQGREKVMSQSVGSLGGANAGWIDGHTLPTGGSRDIYFVDTGVANHQTLVASLPTDAQVIHIGRDENGVARIAEALAGQTNISGIHILSHGDDGTVHLGNTSLRSDNLGTYASLLQSWANALGVDADILFYGCNLAGSSAGKAFIDEIARLTGADVAASDNLTGHSLLGGDWYLEYHTGAIEAQPIEALEYKDTLFVVNVDWTSLSYPTGMTQATFSDVGMSGLDVRITLVPDPGLTLTNVLDIVLETGQPEALSVSISPSTFGQGVNLVVEYFVTGTTMVVSVGTQVVTVTDIDASVSGSPIQDFQDQVMATASSMNPNSVGVAGSLVFDGSSTVVAMTDAGTNMGALENATFSFTSGSYTGLELFFNDGPGVPTNPSGVPTNHVVGLLGPFSFDAPEVRLIGTPGTQVEGSGSGTMLYVYTVGLTDSMGNGLTSSAPTTVTYSVTGGVTNPADDMSDFSAGTTVIIPANSSTGFFTVTVTEDTVPEFDETFEVMLTGSVFMLGGTTVATGTIINDDSPTIGFLNTTFTANEGNSGTMDFLFTITLSESAPFPVTVSFTTADGTADSTSDYATMAGNAVFTAGQTAFVVTVPVSGDTLLEPDETFTVMLSNAMAPGVTPSIVASLATGSIINDDTNPGVTLLGPTTFNEGNVSNNQIYTLSLSATNATPTTVTFALANGTADNNDYTPFTQTIAIPAGQPTFTVPVTILGDSVPEADETFSVSITAVEVFGMSILTSTILNDDMLSVSILGGAAIMELESATTTPFSFTISLNQTAGVPVTVSYLTNNVSATAGSDYVDNDNTVVFAPGQSLATVVVTGIDDAIAEPDETFTVNLMSVMGPGGTANAILAAPSIATGTILNDDLSAVSILELSQAEGTGMATNFIFTLSLDATNSLPITVTYATMDGTATTADNDYTAIAGNVVTFNPGTQTIPVTVTVSGDTIPEPNETFLVQITGTNGASGMTEATGTIVNDDFVQVFLQGSISQLEDLAGNSTYIYSITLNQTAAADITVIYQTMDGSATAGTDYTGIPTTTLVIPAGMSVSAPITVTGIADATNEPDENFFVQLTGVNSPDMLASLSTFTQATGFLLNDDLGSVMVGLVSGLSLLEGMAGTTNAIFTVTLSETTTGPITVEFSTMDGTAMDNSDYAPQVGVLTIAAGMSTALITVPVSGDTIPENDETFLVQLGMTNATPGNTQVTGTIVNDDFLGVAILGSISAFENQATNSTYVYTISLSGTTAAADITVDFSTMDGAATTADMDYTPNAGSVIIPAGQTTQLVTVTVIPDSAIEPDENFFVTISMASGAGATIIPAQSTATGVILNDDVAVGITPGTVSVIEDTGPFTPSNLVYSITLSNTVNLPVTVSFSTMDGTATTSLDFQGNMMEVVFPAGNTLQLVTITTIPDGIPETNEDFTVGISSTNPNVTVNTPSATGVILDNDFAIVGISGPPAMLEGTAMNTDFVFNLSLAQTANFPVTVTYVLNDITTDAMDYVPPATVAIIPAGSISVPITITVIGDSDTEPDETFAVQLTGASGASIFPNSAVATILDDDLSEVSLIPGTVSQLESMTAFVYTVSLSQTLNQPVVVTFQTNPGTAMAGDDFTDIMAGVVTFNPGQSTVPVTVTVVDDGLPEGNEDFTVQLTQVSTNAMLVGTLATGVIQDNDPLGVGLSGVLSATELDTGTDTMSFVYSITLTQTAAQPVTVSFSTADGMTNPAMSTEDYVGIVNNTVVISAGASAVPVTVTVSGDTLVEPDEEFFVNLVGTPTSATGLSVTFTNTQATGIILNNDLPTVSLVPGTVTQLESNTAFVYTISLSETVNQPVVVTYQTNPGTAMTGDDFLGITAAVVTLTAGQTTVPVTVTVVDDILPEGNEDFTVNLTGSNAMVVGSLATGVILDNDPLGVGLSGLLSATELDAGTDTMSFVYSITLTQTAAQPVTVSFSTADGMTNPATSTQDYGTNAGTVVIPAGSSSALVTVTASGDTVVEPDEEFFVNLVGTPTSATGLSVTLTNQTQATGIILNNDLPTVSLVPGTVTQLESNTAFVYTISLSETVNQPVVVTYQTNPGMAVSPDDFGGITAAVVTLTAGQTTVPVTVTVVDDMLPEGNEDFTVNLTGSNAMVVGSLATGVIQDNDPLGVGLSGVLSATELDTGTDTMSFVYSITLTQTAAQPVTVSFSTADGMTNPAMSTEDYVGIVNNTVVIPAGSLSAPVTVTVSGDTLVEPDEEFFVNLVGTPTSATGLSVTFTNTQATGVILNNDLPTVNLVPGTVTQLESNTAFVYTISLSETVNQPVVVTYQTNPGMAVSPDDFGGITAAVVTLTAGQTTVPVTVTVVDDMLPEGNEDFTVNLTGSNAMVVGSLATGVIQDNDPLGVGLSGVLSATELDTGTDTMSFVYSITLTQTAAQPVTVSFSTADGMTNPATSTQDYGTNAGTVVIPAGSSSALVTVTASGDTVVEPDEEFFVNLVGTPTSATGLSVTLTNQTQATGIILNNDLPTVSLVPGTVTQLESNTAFVYTISLSETVNQPVVVTYQTNPGTAMTGDDFLGITAAVVTLTAGQTTVPVTVTVVDDMLPEGNEDFTVNLTGSNAMVVGSLATGVIQDNDPLGVGLSGVLSATELDTGTDTMSFVYSITLTQTAAQPVTVSFSTADGMTNPAMSTEDYVGIVNNTVVIPAGSLSAPVTVTVSGDTLVEPDEEFFVNLVGTPTSATGLSVTLTNQTQATGIILNNDLPTVSLVPGTVTQLESNTAFVYTISLSETVNQPVVVTYQTNPGTAMTGDDFLGITAAVVTLTAGQTTVPVTVTVVDDMLPEGNEDFTVNLTGSNAMVVGSLATGVIQDNDPLGVGLSGVLSATELDTGTDTMSFVYSITLTQTAAQPVTVSFSTADGMTNPAMSTEDYVGIVNNTVVIPVGSLSVPVTVTVSGDTLVEPDEEFFVNLVGTPTSATGLSVTFTNTQATGVILNNDVPTVSLVPGTVTQLESNTAFVYTISLSETVNQPVVVTYQTNPGTAMTGDDFLGITAAVVTLTAGQTTVPVTVTVVDDMLPEGNEDFTVNLTGSNAMVVGSLATGVIQDNDPLGVGLSGVLSATELDTGTDTMSFVYSITLTQTVAQPVTVSFSTADGMTNPATSTQDYVGIVNNTVVIPAGSLSAPVTVTVSGDTMVEPDEEFFVNLVGTPTSATGLSVTFTNTQATGVILNNDLPTVSLVPGTVTQLESNTAFVYTISLSETVNQPVVVTYQTNPGTAMTGDDFLGITAAVVTLTAGQTTVPVTVTVVDDMLPEGNEDFTVNLTGSNAMVVGSLATGVIQDNDPLGVGLSGVLSATELDTGTDTMSFVYSITLTQTAAQPVTVSFSTADGMTNPAMSTEDYVGIVNNTVVIPVGSLSVPVTVTVSGDTLVEPDEEFFVNLVGTPTSATGLSVTFTNTQATGVILNNDVPTVSLVPGTVTQLESNTAFVYTISLSETVNQPVVVTYQTNPGTAMTGDDFLGITAAVVTLTAGQTTVPVTVTVVDDMLPEGNEDFTVNLTGSNAMVVGSLATGVIQDNDPLGVGLSGVLSATELDTGTDTMSFVYSITLTQTAAQPVTVSFSTADGMTNPAMSTEDYVGIVNNTVVIPVGSLSVPVTVTVSGDTMVEPDEEFFVNLVGTPTSATGLSVTFTNTQATGVILNNDLPTVSLVPGTVTQLESNTAFVYTISLSETVNQPVVVTYQTNPGTAMTGDDFLGITAAVVTLTAGQTTVPVTVTVVDDMLPEGNEDFTVNLTGSNAMVVGSLATGVIQDNDPLGVGLSGVLSATELDTGTDTMSFVYSITLTQTAAQPVTVSFSTADGMTNPAMSTEDYVGIVNNTVVIPAGSLSAPVTVTVSGDTMVEPDEEFFVNLVGTPTSATGLSVTFTNTQATGVILNNDVPTVSLVPGTVTQLESNTAFVYTISLSETVNQPVVVTYQTNPGTAMTGDDFLGITAAVVTLTPGQLTQLVTVTGINDDVFEPDETFTVVVTGTNGVLGASQATAVLINDDPEPLPTPSPAPTPTPSPEPTPTPTPIPTPAPTPTPTPTPEPPLPPPPPPPPPPVVNTTAIAQGTTSAVPLPGGNFNLVAAPSNGFVQVNFGSDGIPNTPDDFVVFTPNPGFEGVDSFTFTVLDPNGNLITVVQQVQVGELRQDPRPQSPEFAPFLENPRFTSVLILDVAGQFQSLFDANPANPSGLNTIENYFDAALYLRLNPGLANLFPDLARQLGLPTPNPAPDPRFPTPLDHFRQVGQRDNLRPSYLFDPEIYALYNPDAVEAVRSGRFPSLFQHFLEVGQYDWRDPRILVFDPGFYEFRNSRVEEAIHRGQFGTPFNHFMEVGRLEDRQPSLLFDPEFYLLRNPAVQDEIAAGRFESAFDHFIRVGLRAGLEATPFFNAERYLAQFPDVAQLIAQGRFGSAYEHYLRRGQFEERPPRLQIFDEGFYLRNNPDVREAIAAGRFVNGLHHFTVVGQFENRDPGPYFDTAFYLRRYPDVAAAVQRGEFRSAFDHFARIGRFEDRLTVPPDEPVLFNEVDLRIVPPGERLTYTFTVVNDTGSDTTGVWVQAILPPNLPDVVVSNGGRYDPATGIVLFPQLPRLNVGERFTATATFGAPRTPSIVTGALATAYPNTPLQNTNIDIGGPFSANRGVIAYGSSSQGDRQLMGLAEVFVSRSVAVTFAVPSDRFMPPGILPIDQTLQARPGNGLNTFEDYFDEAFYLATYPQVAQAIARGEVPNAREHFLRIGQVSGLQPSLLFDESVYRQYNPQAVAAVQRGEFRSLFEHFLQVGQYQNADPRLLLFDEGYYLFRNSIVKEQIRRGEFQSAFEHFIKVGQFQNRAPSELFDPQFYLANNPGVEAAVARGEFRSAFDHFIRVGLQGGLRSSRWFVPEEYLAINTGVAAEIPQLGFASPLEHFLRRGLFDQRLSRANDPLRPLFDEGFYLANNPDVAAAVRRGEFRNGLQHFVQVGQFENRDPGPLFDTQFYLSIYPDVTTSLTRREFRSAFDHYVRFGRSQERVTVPTRLTGLA